MKKTKIILIAVCCIIVLAAVIIGIGQAKTKNVTETGESLQKPENTPAAVTEVPAVNTEKDSAAENTEPARASQIEETVNEDGSRTVVVTATDGTQTTIVIRSEDGSPQSVSEEQKSNESEKTESDAGLSFEEYSAMSGEEQYAYFLTFGSTDEFFEWYNKAKEEYEKSHPAIEIGENDVIDMSGK